MYYRGKSRAFSLAYVERLSLEHRKLWLPLIGGGILASLCLLALFHTFNMPYRLLSGVAVGLFGLWWGYRGNTALVVYEQRHHTDYLLRKPFQALPVFIAFSNLIIRRYPQPLGQYSVALSAQEWEQLQKQGFIELKEPRACFPQEIAQWQQAGAGYYWGMFDPFLMGERLQWSLQGKELTAHLQGRLEAQQLQLLTS